MFDPLGPDFNPEMFRTLHIWNPSPPRHLTFWFSSDFLEFCPKLRSSMEAPSLQTPLANSFSPDLNIGPPKNGSQSHLFGHLWVDCTPRRRGIACCVVDNLIRFYTPLIEVLHGLLVIVSGTIAIPREPAWFTCVWFACLQDPSLFAHGWTPTGTCLIPMAIIRAGAKTFWEENLLQETALFPRLLHSHLPILSLSLLIPFPFFVAVLTPPPPPPPPASAFLMIGGEGRFGVFLALGTPHGMPLGHVVQTCVLFPATTICHHCLAFSLLFVGSEWWEGMMVCVSYSG